MKNLTCRILGLCLYGFSIFNLSAQNPLILDQFTADPSARVFNDRVYVYPSHDIPCGPGQGFIGFCMADYHVFSSEDLFEWEDHGVILDQWNVDWVDSTRYSMWAPDCIEKNGKYYFYFPAIATDSTLRRRIGVAIADTPTGPFIPESRYIDKVVGIDPNPFIDKDGKAYLYWGGGDTLRMAPLKENMVELAAPPQPVIGLPSKFKEGPYLFERNGIYYFTFPHVPETTERLVYATADNPMGPFEYRGVIMDESPVACWTNHHSIIEYQNQWYLFYHHNDLSPHFDKNRSIKADSLFFNEDGTIQKVTPTLRGVGITPATSRIQIDRYSEAAAGVTFSYLDSLNTMLGWKVVLTDQGDWVRYNQVRFDNPTQITLNALTNTGATIEVRVGSVQGELITKMEIKPSEKWTLSKANIETDLSGNLDLFFILSTTMPISIDWVQFD